MPDPHRGGSTLPKTCGRGLSERWETFQMEAAARGGPGKSGTRLPSSPVWTQSGQRIQLALIQVEARLGYTVRAHPCRARAVGHIREDTVPRPKDEGR